MAREVLALGRRQPHAPHHEIMVRALEAYGPYDIAVGRLKYLFDSLGQGIQVRCLARLPLPDALVFVERYRSRMKFNSGILAHQRRIKALPQRAGGF